MTFELPGDLSDAINKYFDTFDKFKDTFTSTAATRL